MSLKPRTKSAAPARVKSGKPPRKGTAATPVSRSARTETASTWVKGEPKAGKLVGKTTVRAGSKPAFKSSKPSSNTPAKRAKNGARSLERAKRFADTRGAGSADTRPDTREFRDDSRGNDRTESRAPRANKFTPARRVDTRIDTRDSRDSRNTDTRDSRGSGSRDSRNSDTRPTTRRDARIAEVARGDGRPNFEPQKRAKFIPGGKRVGGTSSPSRSTHSGRPTPTTTGTGAARTSTPRTTENYAPRTSANTNPSTGAPHSRDERGAIAAPRRDSRDGDSRGSSRSNESRNFAPRSDSRSASNFRGASATRSNNGPAHTRGHNAGHNGRGSNNFSNNEFVTDFGADDNYIMDAEQETTDEALHHKPTEHTDKTFADLGIAPALVAALTAQGIESPFPIQVATLPDAIKGHDILGRGQTGSGKTLAFGLALLTNLEGKQAAPHRPLGLILTPTRELALQINDVITPLARAVRLDSVVIAGGMPYAKQITAMRKSCPILVATPGRLIDLLDKGEVQLDDLQITILDEADQMADMGFLPVVKEILDQAKPNGQRLLFSATLDRGVDSLVKKYLNTPKTHSLQNDRASVSTMEHHVLVMHAGDKDEITAQIAARDGRTILFVKTQRGADRLADKLASVGVAVGALHGGKSQAVRTRTLAMFKANTTAALVATDVAARGIHVDGVSLVVHVDAPTDHKDYLHRAGRTARAGEAGVVVTLATSKQQTAVRGLTSRAGVYPKFVDVRPHHAELVSITGSKEPSGIAYIAPVEPKSDFGGARRRPRPGQDQRRRRPR